MSLLASLSAVAAILAAVIAVGRLLAPALVPAGSAWRGERWAWSLALGAALLSIQTGFAVALGFSAGWFAFLVASAVAAPAVYLWRLPSIGRDIAPAPARPALLRWCLLGLLVSGVVLYGLRALTEPMWSNDYLAIWGLKAKTIFFARALPARAWPEGSYPFAHREYPLGLPLLYAGIAFLGHRWDDHALALLFPVFQLATLAALFGWLRRRGIAWPVPLAAAALLSQCEPLYSGFLTGLAEVPLSCVLLLLGTALADCLDPAAPPDDPFRPIWDGQRRLAVASLLAAAVKNEGVFFAVSAAVVALFTRASGRWRTVACALLPAVAAVAVTRWSSAGAALRDFDFRFLGPRLAELPDRLAEALRAAIAGVALPAWPGLLAVAVLALAGRGRPFADCLLWLVAAGLAAYVLLPALAVPGPTWLVRTTLARTAAALAPLLTAGLAGRLGASSQPTDKQ